MIKKIIKDSEKLSTRCISSTRVWIEHKQIVEDLLDTANHHNETSEEGCAGLAANQIGCDKRIIVVLIKDKFVAMVNPEYIVKQGGVSTEEEGCLSFPGKLTKKRRYKKVKISFFDPIKNKQIKKFTLKGFEARVLQHEIDHLNGVTI